MYVFNENKIILEFSSISPLIWSSGSLTRSAAHTVFGTSFLTVLFSILIAKNLV